MSKTKTELEVAIQNKQVKQPGLLKRMTADRTLIHNLAMMNIVWISASFIFFLLGFLVKYMPGDIYINSLISGLSAFIMLALGVV